MIRAEDILRVIENWAARLYFCHDWAMAEPKDLCVPSGRQALSI